jgi:hypothetical protein
MQLLLFTFAFLYVTIISHSSSPFLDELGLKGLVILSSCILPEYCFDSNDRLFFQLCL